MMDTEMELSDSHAQVPAARIVFGGIDEAEIAERVKQVLRRGILTLGPETRQFERDFASAHGATYAVAVSSGTAALEIVLRTVGVAGRDVIMPANTFAATAFAVQAAGGRPVLADVDPATLSLTADTVREAMTTRTAAVIAVHIGGVISPHIESLAEMTKQAGVKLLEDAAHAHGSSLAGQFAGSFGVAGAFSFYPTKLITCGEGGIIVTSEEHIRDAAIAFRDQGKASFHDQEHVRQGYAWRMSEVNASTGVVHLKRLPNFLAVRRRVADRYDRGLREMRGISPMTLSKSIESNYYKYIALLDNGVARSELKSLIREKYAVSLPGEVYDRPLYAHPVFASLRHGTFPVADRFCARHVCLPIHSDMTDGEADRVLDAVGMALAQMRTDWG